MTVTVLAMDDPAALRRLLGECAMPSIWVEHIIGMGYTAIAMIAHAVGDADQLEAFSQHLSLVRAGETFSPFSPQTATIRRAVRDCMTFALDAGRSSAPDPAPAAHSFTPHSCRAQRVEGPIHDQLSR